MYSLGANCGAYTGQSNLPKLFAQAVWLAVCKVACAGASPCSLSNTDSLQGGIPKPFGQLACQAAWRAGGIPDGQMPHAVCQKFFSYASICLCKARRRVNAPRSKTQHTGKEQHAPQKAKRADRYALAAPKKVKTRGQPNLNRPGKGQALLASSPLGALVLLFPWCSVPPWIRKKYRLYRSVICRVT